MTGYGRSNENEGVSVQLKTDNETIKKMFEEIPVPHITISVSQDGKAVNTKDLEFAPVEEFELRGIYGAFIKEKKKVVICKESV